MLITFTGMGLSLFFHIMIPWYLEVSETADALIAALKVVLLVDIILREGAKFSLVPLFIHEETGREKVDFHLFTSGIINFSLCVGVVLMLLIEFFSPLIARSLLWSSSSVVQSQMTTILRLCAPLVIFGSGSTIIGAYLNSQKYFKTVACRNALPPLMAVIIFLFLSKIASLAYYVAVAYACGFMIYFVWLCIGMYRAGYRHRFTWISYDALHSLKDAVSLPTIGFTIRQISARLLVEVFLVGKLGKGAITLYNSAFRIFSAIQTLIGNSIATIGLPDMTTASVENNILNLREKLSRNIHWVVYIAVPLTCLLFLGASKISNILFSGDKFDPQSVKQVGHLLIWLSIGTVFSCLIPVLNAGLYAQKAFGLIFRNMVTMAVLNFILALTLMTFMGLNGIAFTVSITALLATGNLVYLLRKTGVFLYLKSN